MAPKYPTACQHDFLTSSLRNTCRGSHLASFGNTEVLGKYKCSKELSTSVSMLPRNHKEPVSSALLNEPDNADCLYSCSSESARTRFKKKNSTFAVQQNSYSVQEIVTATLHRS